ncbi:MAG: DEAD/DEAH box helicase [Kiritimatiellae bacterium]|nr:DEAD/DEAH box helicase [Kiritimatiellia bacterium]
MKQPPPSAPNQPASLPHLGDIPDDTLRVLATYLFHTRCPNSYRWQLSSILRDEWSRILPDTAILDACKFLAARGWLKRDGHVSSLYPGNFHADPPSPSVALAVLAELEQGNLLGDPAKDDFHCSQSFTAYLKVLLAFLQGESLLAPFGKHPPKQREIWWLATFLLAMAPDDKPFPTFHPPADTPAELLRVLAADRFQQGCDFLPVLETWRNLLADPIFAKASLPADHAEYMALCLMAGCPSWLDALPAQLPPPAADFRSGCKALLAGDVQAAAKGFAQIDAECPPGRADEYIPHVIATPASNLLSLFAQAFSGKPAQTRIARLAKRLAEPATFSEWSLPLIARNLRAFRREHAASYRPLFDPDAPHLPQHDFGPHPWAEAGVAASAALSAYTRAEAQDLAPMALIAARRAEKLGLPTLAAAWLSAFAWAMPPADAAEAAKMADRLKTAGAAWFRPWDGAAAKPWKQIVLALGQALPPAGAGGGTGRAAAVRAGRLVWQVGLVRNVLASNGHWYNREPPQPGALCDCIGIAAFLRGPRAPSDGTADRPLTYRALLSGKYDAILTDPDRALVAALRSVSSDPKRYPAATADVLAALCAIPDPTRAPTTHDTFPADPAKALPCAFVRRDLPLSAKSAPGGGMALAVEPWCIGFRGDAAILCLAEDEYAVIPFPRAARATLDVFANYGDPDRGTLDLPKEALPDLKPLLPRLAALAPLQGELSAMGGDAGLPRLDGDPTPLVRLRLDAGTLTLTLHARPLAGNPLVLVPGAGQPERLVAHDGKSAILVRDLAAEKKGAAAVHAALADYETWAASPTQWAIDDLPAMLGAIDALRALGKTARLEWLSPKKLSVTSPVPSSWRVTAAGGADRWFTVKGDFRLDDGRAATLSALIDAWQRRTGEYVPFGDDAYIRLTSALSRRLEALAAAARPAPGKEGRDGAIALPPAALPLLDAAFDPAADAAAGLSLPAPLADRAAAIRDAFAASVQVPARLTAVLRPYQHDGYLWLSRLAAAGLGSCLADDMGLGKTLQLIALLLARAADGPSLVVAPASVCGNWRGELRRFAPTLRPIMAWDADADATDAALAAAGPGDIVIAGYSLLSARADAFAARPWNGVVLDEAQAIKNEDTLRARAVRRLSARFRCAATGTPVENRLADIWSLFEFLNPGLLGTPADFARRFAADGRPAPALKRLLAPLILRRRKRDVLDDLPAKTEITLPVLLSDGERAGYETLRRRALENLDRTGGKTNRISILAELTRLRRYCCHPSLVLGPGSGIPSAKLDTLLRLLSTLRENRHRALVFSQFTDGLAIVRRALDGAGHTHLYLDGQTPSADRARLVDAFQRGEGDFFLISLKAGGLGLNLTAADYVILLDPWWNPAVENQAADRAHRIGQTNPVTVYRLIASDTVEERVLALHAEKRALSADLLDAASSAPDLTPDLLLSLFQ